MDEVETRLYEFYGDWTAFRWRDGWKPDACGKYYAVEEAASEDELQALVETKILKQLEGFVSVHWEWGPLIRVVKRTRRERLVRWITETFTIRISLT